MRCAIGRKNGKMTSKLTVVRAPGWS
jgi:hypothetical protein